MHLVKIDEVAKQTGLTKRTIRYYEEIGILPEPQRTERGTRLYSEKDIDLLKKIVNAKEVLGFSLQELQKYIAISEVLESKKVVYRSANNEQEQKEKLAQIINVVNEQLGLIEVKLDKIQKVKQELEELRTRAANKVKQLEE
ncbi:MerR family transcriptional regulator [Neobacillus sp. SM06]|uniref:MerR family transcriptional regulator n=1 Tax=Neobacillus sp. SM06 TaxID=3422492 RepID=UPI003D296C7D